MTKEKCIDDFAEVKAARERLEVATKKHESLKAELRELQAQATESDDEAMALLHGQNVESVELDEVMQKVAQWSRVGRVGQAELDRATSKAQKELTQAEQPRLVEAQRKMFGSLMAYVESVGEYKQYIYDCSLRGVMCSPEIYNGSPSTGFGGSLATWTQNLIDSGLLQKNDVPKNLRTKWGIK